ncbi:MAG: PAS domain-containing protein [Actinomycetales bacterium]|nr:PAS domain-containing protein [Actinomycetales bacterium]
MRSGAEADPRARRGRARVSSAVLSSQLLISAAALVMVVAVLFLDTEALGDPALFAAIGLIFALTAVAALVPWGSVPKRWGAMLPLLNIVAIVAVSAAAPTLGAPLLLIFPIIWLARSFGPRETIVGFALAFGSLLAVRILGGSPLDSSDFASLLLVPIVLGFAATSISISSSRARAQTVLLRQHARHIERALESARRQEELRDAVLNVVSFGVVAFDREGRVTFVNRWQRRALADFGAPPGAVVHPLIYQADEITPFSDDERPFGRALAGQSFDNVVFWVGEPGGRRAAYSASCRGLTDAEGEYDGGVIMVRDVTAELEAVRARDDLIGSVTHELRSPLTSVLGYLDLVRDDESLQEETRRMLDVAGSNAERLLVIVTDLLQAASDATMKLEMAFLPMDLRAVAEDAVDAARLLARDRQVSIELHAPREVHVLADPARLRQVLDNLVTNAIKYNRPGGTVIVRVAREGANAVAEVQDTGRGIAPGDLPRVFDRFYRTAEARSSRSVGTGLGLAVSRDIAERHGGELSVQSVLDEGSTFRLRVPVSRAAELPRSGANDESRETR